MAFSSNEIITIESDDDDIQEIPSTSFPQFNKRFEKKDHKNSQSSGVSVSGGGHNFSMWKNNGAVPYLNATASGISNHKYHQEVVGTATASILNERPINIFELTKSSKPTVELTKSGSNTNKV